jgi:2-(1,2-epoxy-1,2-dihydrophenyl)acetyl-CoA isomerase
MSETRETVTFETMAGGVGLLTLNRPDARNALGPEDWALLAHHLERAEADPDVRVVLLTGAGKAFCAGGDVRTMPERLALSPDVRRAALLRDARAIRLLVEMEKPTLAAVNGPAVGAGLSLACACDLRLASENARFGAGFVRVGLASDFGAAWLLPRVIGRPRAMELCYTGELVDAGTAVQMGLVNRVWPQDRFAAEAVSFARQVATGAPIALALTKKAILRSDEMDLSAALEYEAMGQAIASRTEDAAEGVAAVASRRPPSFKGR